MNIEDVVYLVCLLACIGFGLVMRKIKDDSQRKLVSTAFGVLIVLIVSGLHILHCFISFGLCALAIKYVHPSKCHLVSFAIMFGYLAFFRTTSYFGLPSVPGHTNMIQMILTLKISGIAFEKNAAYKKIQQRKKETDERNQPSTSSEKKDLGPLVELTDYDMEMQSISVVEMFHYSFNYFGILTGPYYRYRTYRDYFEMPFKDHAKSTEVTLQNLKYAGLYSVLYLIANYIWPLSYALSDEFYQDRSVMYRMFYIWPSFFIFRMRIYTGLTLSECVCTMAGFGAYPDESNAVNGEGPKGQYDHLKRDADKKSYNFTTVVNLRAYDTEVCMTMREAMKHWNICVQYWLAVNVYKNFPSKKYRTIVTLLTSSFWHGFMPGHYFCIMGAPFYVPVEDMLSKLYRKDTTGIKRQIIDASFCISKFFALSYLGMAFQLLTFKRIWFFYSSVYHLGYVYWAVIMAFAVFMTNQKRGADKRKKRALEKDSTAQAAGQKEKDQ